MSAKLRCLACITNLFVLVFLVLHVFPVTVFSNRNCQLYHDNTILDCTNMNTFPNGLYRTVKIIKFARNNYTELKSYVFRNHSFYNLEKAVLRHSNIQIIHPNTFSDMHQLTYLDLCGNHISELDDNSFTGLPSLKHLVLGKNQIITINERVFKPLALLDTLDLSFNQINNLHSDFLKYTNVSQLKLSNNPIHFRDATPIISSSSLLKLTLQSCNLKELHQKSFSKITKLIFLDLSKNLLKNLPANLFKPLNHLKSLDIGNNSIDHLDVKVFPIPNDIDVLVCNKNPLEDTQNCSEILFASKQYNSSAEINLSTEGTSYSDISIESVHNNNQAADQHLQVRKDSASSNSDVNIEVLQYKMLIGFSIGLIILVVIVVLQAFFIVKCNEVRIATADCYIA